MLTKLSKFLFFITNYLFFIVNFIITISAIKIFLICLNPLVCPFFLYLLANSLDINIFCYTNEDANHPISYCQHLDSNFSQTQTTDIPIHGTNENEMQGESNNLPNTKVSLLTSAKDFYKVIVNKARRRFYWETLEIDKNNYNSFNDFKKNWDPNVKIRKEIESELKADLAKLNLHKNTFLWFLNIRKHK